MIYGELPGGNANMTCTNDVCDDFHVLYSANRGDYFWQPSAATVRCYNCHEPMSLAHESRVLVIEGEEL